MVVRNVGYVRTRECVDAGGGSTMRACIIMREEEQAEARKSGSTTR